MSISNETSSQENTLTFEPMTDEPTLLAEPKPGWKTTEFWLMLLAVILAAVQSSGLLMPASVAYQITAVGLAVLGALGYTAARTVAKRSTVSIPISLPADEQTTRAGKTSTMLVSLLGIGIVFVVMFGWTGCAAHLKAPLGTPEARIEHCRNTDSRRRLSGGISAGAAAAAAISTGVTVPTDGDVETVLQVATIVIAGAAAAAGWIAGDYASAYTRECVDAEIPPALADPAVSHLHPARSL